MTREEIKVLVAFLVTNAKSDQTAPPSWLLDTLLRGVEKHVLHELGLPLVFADICLRASGAVTTDPTANLIIRLGRINGLRRVVVTSGEVEVVHELFDCTKREIDALPESPRKERLVSFWQYQSGVFMARNGYYDEAVETQLYAASLATSTEAENVIARYLAKVYKLWGALIDGDQCKIDNRLAYLASTYYTLLRVGVKGTVHEAQWGLGNGPLHILQGYIWAGITVPPIWDELYLKVREAAEKIPAFAEWAEVLGVVDNLKHGADTEAFALAAGLIFRSSDPNVVATCRLLKARLLLARGAPAEARACYLEIQPLPDCHQVAAVAARELAALPAS